MAIITLPLPNIFANGTTADANQINADLNQITANVNANAAANGANADITSMSALSTISHALTVTSIDSTPIGQTTPAAGKFTTLSATNMDSTPIGATTPAAGSFTTLAASGAITAATTLGVTGAATLSSTLGVTGLATLTGGAALAGPFSNSVQPSFRAHRAANQTSGTTIIFDTSDYQVGGTNYSISTGLFTAKYTGIHSFKATVGILNNNASTLIGQIDLVVNGTVIASGSSSISSGTRVYVSVFADCQMTAGQTASISTPGSWSAASLTISGATAVQFSGSQLF